MSMASGMFISVVSLLYPICKSFLPQIPQILTDIAMGIIIRVNLCHPWDMISHADCADARRCCNGINNLLNLRHPRNMISHADFADFADTVLGRQL